MRFGIFTTLYDCGGGAGTPAEVLDNLREQVGLAEELGYDAVWMGEHHFGPYGLGDLPNPILVGADLAARTRRIRIGQMANIAVWWHPVRLAEDLAILDNLTRGLAARSDMQARSVFAGEAWPERHREGVVDGGAEKFLVIKMPTRWGSSIPNDFIAAYVARYPGRAVGFAAVDPNEPGAAAEVERSLGELGLRGLKLSPVYHAFDPWSAPAWALYEMADAFRAPVMFHMGGAYDPEASLEWGSPLLLDRVARAFPRLRLIVAHLGQPMMQETVMLMRKNPNVYADLSARFHRRWQLYNGLQVAIEYGVTDRLLFGSDFPVMTTGRAAEAFRAINDWGEGVRLPLIPPELIDAILYERPLDLLGLA